MDVPLNLEDCDPRFPEMLALEPGCGHLWRCVGCGTCTALCPVSAVNPEFSPGLILRQVLLGLKREVLAAPLLWQCARCARCSYFCPQEVRFVDIIQALQRLAVEEGYLPPEVARRVEEAEALLARLRQRTLERLTAPGTGALSPREVLSRTLREMDPEHEGD
ncbi:MAG: 4Fe-4S dicluster domain-containing protein [Syntrophobacterales bacterium]|nr:4Fe-4S dicluster domain-containing protein [Syntrophobacterales bacterium]